MDTSHSYKFAFSLTINTHTNCRLSSQIWRSHITPYRRLTHCIYHLVWTTYTVYYFWGTAHAYEEAILIWFVEISQYKASPLKQQEDVDTSDWSFSKYLSSVNITCVMMNCSHKEFEILISIIPPVFHTHPFVYHRRHTAVAITSVVKQSHLSLWLIMYVGVLGRSRAVSGEIRNGGSCLFRTVI
jgi:hypothetical protein